MQQHQQTYQPTSFEYAKIVSIVHAVVLVSFGIIFPIAEALKDQWLKTIYNTVFLVTNLTLSCIFLIYLLFFILRYDTNNSIRNVGGRWRKLRRLPANIKYLFGKDRNFRQSRKDQMLTNGNEELIENEQILEMVPAKNKRDYSICSNASSTGIDLGVLRKSSILPDNSSDKDVFISTREIRPVSEIEGIKCKRCSTVLESGSEYCEDESNCYKKLQDDNNNDNNELRLEMPSILNYTQEDPITYVDAESLGGVFTHHGSSMFLRLGALVFGLGNLVYYALEIQANLFYNVECSNTLRFGWIFIWKFVFVFLQTFFLFKHATVHVTKHKPLVWFGMVHLIFTNVTLWIHTLVREIAEEYHYVTLSEHYHSNISEFEEALHSKCDSDLLHSATKYLMPFVLEYSLIAVGSISCFLYFGGMDDSHQLRMNRHLVRVFSLAPSDFAKYNITIDSPPVDRQRLSDVKVHFSPSVTEESMENKKAEVVPVNHHHNSHDTNPLQKSHVGLFGGIVVLCLTVVTCVVFLFSNLQGHPTRGEVVFYSADIIIHSLLLVACLAVFVLTRSLAFAPKPISTDDILLLIAAFGSLTYEAVNVSALISTMSNGYSRHTNYHHDYHQDHHQDHLPVIYTTASPLHLTNRTNQEMAGIGTNLQLISGMVGLIETAVQTLLILVSLRRYPASLDDAKNMPGRGTLAFLIVGNLSVWILRTVLCKNIETPVQNLFYGKMAWHLLMNINLPLLLFFRFHSSVCFADIWKVAYELFTRPAKPTLHKE